MESLKEKSQTVVIEDLSEDMKCFVKSQLKAKEELSISAKEWQKYIDPMLKAQTKLRTNDFFKKVEQLKKKLNGRVNDLLAKDEKEPCKVRKAVIFELRRILNGENKKKGWVDEVLG